jgi:aspartyl protease family protein
VTNRYLLFALGLLAVVLVLAPWLDMFGNPGAGPAGGGAVGPPVVGSVGPPVVAGAGSAPPPPVTGGGVAVDRDANGQFKVEAMVNDQPLRLVVDTGADTLALGEADARSIGIDPDPSRYTATVTTASGTAYAAHVRVDRLEVAGHDLGAVDALVIRGLNTSLLGLSVLRKVGSVQMSGDRMIINP